MKTLCYPWLWRGALLLLLTGCTQTGWAQAPAEPTEAVHANIVSISPAELFYKRQLGYERRLSSAYSIGMNAAIYPGFRELYKGWHITAYGRRYINKTSPYGLYVQAQASVYEHEQLISIIPIDNSRYGYKTTSYRWAGMGGGAGMGLGYRLPVLKKTFARRLSTDVMLGGRLNWRPGPRFDYMTYRVAADFLPDGFEWFAIGPGSVFHGLLAFGYSF